MDYSKPIEIAKGIFWVGYVVPNDPFQCNVYLIKDGDSSVLIDPGSMITFPIVLEKITSLVKLRDIKYIIMHHQDPDIVSCYSTLESLFPNKERYVVTHWRTQMLLKHYNWKTPFYLIDKNEWKLKTNTRELEFIFTPYAHFAGAFCTYDKESGILFSSDIFGGLTEEFKLFVEEDYIEGAKLFHKHYMPSKDILNYALSKIESKNPTMIASQHGGVIKKELIPKIIKELKSLDCGLYLMDDYMDDIFLLDQIDKIINNIFKEAIILSTFENILKNIYSSVKEYVQKIEKIVVSDINNILIFMVKDYKIFRSNVDVKEDCKFSFEKELFDELDKKVGKIKICYNVELTRKEKLFLETLFKKLSNILGVALKKELTLLKLKKREKELYEKSITDPLTELYNRAFLMSFLKTKLEESIRYNFPLSLAIIDIDFFKKVNDTYGHIEGDCVLQELALLLKKHFRGSDVIA
ncbi:MAG TPA: diguanylate cyclase, partial [Nautiliaceae bacterium]|nr:diguanylate cyclase [Nautiliaceae bacterium]